MENLEAVLGAITSGIKSKVGIYNKIAQKTHGIPAEEAGRIVEGETELFIHRLKKYLQDPLNNDAKITELQGMNIFLEVMESGLSFSPVADHVYVSRLKGTGTSVGYKVTVDGMIHMAQKAGALDHLSEPVLVQKGERFTIENNPDGFQRANHTLFFDDKPQFNFQQFLAGYVYIVYPNGNRELSWISAARMAQLRSKSAKPGSYDDESFVQTKVMKHALRKIRKSAFSNQGMLGDDEDETEFVDKPAVTVPVAPPQPVLPRTNEQAAQQLVESMRQAQAVNQPQFPTQPVSDPFGNYTPPPVPPPPPSFNQGQQWSQAPPPPLPPQPVYRDPFQ